MASDEKKTKTNPAPKNDTPPKNTTTSDVTSPKADGGEKAKDKATNYSRGEGQKPVSQAYKDNWNLIFRKKKKR